jgi:hypothetical protein
MEKDFADQVPYESNDRGRKPPRGWRRKLLNVLHRAFLFVFLLFFCLGILLQFPVFQNWAARKVTAALEKSLETKVRVGHLRIGWMGSLVLKEVLVYDHRPDTLLYCASLTARFDPNIFNLARNGLTINSFSLNDAYLDLYTGPEGGSNNLQQLLDRLLPPRTDKKSTFSVRLKKLALRNIFLRNENRLTGSRLEVKLAKGIVGIDTMDLPGKKLRVGELRLTGPDLAITSSQGSGLEGPPPTPGPAPDSLPWDIAVSEFRLSEGGFSLHNYRLEPQRRSPPGELNYRHLDVTQIQIAVRNFSLLKDTYTGSIENLAFKEKQGFELDQLYARDARVGPQGIALNGMRLITPYSTLGDTLAFRFREFADFQEFNDRVIMDIRFIGARAAISDIVTFAPGLLRTAFFRDNLRESVKLDGKVWGRVNNLKGAGLKVSHSNGSRFDGNFSSRNLALSGEEFLILNVDRFNSSARNFQKLFPGLKLPANFNRLGQLQFKGNFSGFFHNFVAFGSLGTALGSAQTDMQMTLGDGPAKARYKGKLTLTNFDLGKWTGDANQGKISVSASVEEGRGLTAQTAEALLNANIRRFEYKGYAYENATLDGRLRANKFSGNFSIEDENIDLRFSGRADLGQEVPIYDFDLDIKRLALKPLHLVEKNDFVLSGNAVLNLRNKRFADIEGDVKLADFKVETRGQVFELDSAIFQSSFDHFGNKRFSVRSDILNAQLYGLFDIGHIPTAVLQHIVKFYPGFSSRLGISVRDSAFRPTHFDFRVEVVNSKGFETLIDPRMGSLSGVKVAGEFDNRPGIFSADLEADWFQFDRAYFEDIAIGLNIRKAIGDIDLGVKRSVINERQEFDALTLVTSLSADTLHYALNYANSGRQADPAALDYVNIEGMLSLFGEKFLRHQITLPDVVLFGTVWKINGNNAVTFNKESLSIQDFVLTRDNKAVSLESNGARGVELDFLNFDLSELNELIRFEAIKFDAKINASIFVGDLFRLSDLSVAVVSDSLFLNGDDWGILRLDASLEDFKKPLHFYLNLTRDTAQLLAEGYYNLDDFGASYWQKKAFFNLDLNIHSYPLWLAEYFIGGTVSQVKGYFDANLQFSGQSSQPDVQGKIYIFDASLQVDYLKTTYTLDRAVVDVDDFLFDATGAVLKDKYNNTALLQGGIKHRHLRGFGFDARLTTTRFLGLDTKKGDNKLFYGQAMASGYVAFSGSFAQPNIYVNAEAIEGSRVAIPISSDRDAGQLKFFRFVEKDGAGNPTVQAAGQGSEIKGVSIEMELVINESALMQIIFNEQAGDIIEGNGRGALRIVVPRNGSFQMYGDVVIERGEYLFTLYNVINKNFTIQRGSSITWSGDPYRAIIDLKAEYKGLYTSVSTFIQEFMANAGDNVRSEASQSTVVNLLLNLKGELLSPAITFDMSFPNLRGQLLSYTENKLRLLRQDPNEMNKQVFGLIMAGQFLPSDFSFQGSQIIYNTVSEFLSNQLSLMISELFSDLLGGQALSSVDFDIAYNQYQNTGLAQSGALNRGNELQVSFRQNYFNDRLSILVGGNIDLGNNWRTATGATGAFIGNDLVIEYQLIKDRSMKLRIYQKLLPDISGRILRVGTGLSLRKEFDSFGEFLRSFRAEGKKTQKPPPPPTPQDSSSLGGGR